MSPIDHLDVIVIGALGIDTSIFLYQDKINESSETNFAENIDYIGQAGGYTSMCYYQLNYKTGFIGSIGDDLWGNYIKYVFKQRNIKSYFFIDPQGTNRSINLMDNNGKRRNFYDAKSAMDLIPDLKKSRELIKKTKVCHFHISNWCRYLLPIAKDENKIIVSDLQDIHDLDEPYLYDFIFYSDIIFFSGIHHKNPTLVLRKFIDLNPDKIFIVGLGSEGCGLGNSEGVNFFKAVELPKPVVDTNGAGDGLAVGFISSYILENYNIHESILRGQILARKICSIKASTDNLICINELNSLYNERL